MDSSILNDPNFLNICLFGSRVYGTHHRDSDYDYICVVKEKKEALLLDKDGNHLHLYTPAEFEYGLSNCDIQMLEVFFAPQECKIKEYLQFTWKLNKEALRKSISTIASNSWVKGKKKLIVSADYDKYLAVKSVFHSLRILDLGIQVARESKIMNYASMNFVYEDLMKLASQYDRSELWQKIEDKYRKLFNKLSGEFKVLAPKGDSITYNIRNDLNHILAKYEIKNKDLLNDLTDYVNRLS